MRNILFFFRRSPVPSSTKNNTKHPWVKLIQFCSRKRPWMKEFKFVQKKSHDLSCKGNNGELMETHLQNENKMYFNEIAKIK